jgi:Double-GTPase 2
MNNNIPKLNIIMVAPRGVGKTSILAALHEEFNKTFEMAGLNTWTTDTQTLDSIEECKRLLRNMDYRLQRLVDPTPPKIDPWEDQGFVFDVGSGGKKFMRVQFTDPSGEYFKPSATPEQKGYVMQQLNECDAVIIPIDSTALMEKKTGRTKIGELSPWHEFKNDPERITHLLKDAYANLAKPRLVILAPLKCEAYMKTDKEANNLLDHIKIGYRDLLDFFREEERYTKLAVVVTPIQTIGHIAFSHAETIDDYIRFYYNKEPLDAPYEPKNGDQILRYVLRFLLNVFNESQAIELEKAKADLLRLEREEGYNAIKLTDAKKRLTLAETKLNERNKVWTPLRHVYNIFDNVPALHDDAKNFVSETKSTLKIIEDQKYTVQEQADATVAQIQAFNLAISRFAIDCKQDCGFAILQGRARWLPIPKM